MFFHDARHIPDLASREDGKLIYSTYHDRGQQRQPDVLVNQSDTLVAVVEEARRIRATGEEAATITSAEETLPTSLLVLLGGEGIL